MGVYYDASIVWGLRIPESDEIRGNDLEDVYQLPAGYSYSMGGDLMSDVDITYVLHPKKARATILETAGTSDSDFGVHAVDDIFQPTTQQRLELQDFAIKYDIDARIGWFAVSSVG